MTGGDTYAGSYDFIVSGRFPDGTESKGSFVLDVGCNNPTFTNPDHDTIIYGNLGQTADAEVNEFSHDKALACIVRYNTTITSDQPTDWLDNALLSSGRGVSWNATDLNQTKIGDYTITITAKLGCNTATTSFTLSIADECGQLDSPIDCEDTVFKDPDSFGPSMTYELYSGLQSLTWDNSVLF